MQGVQMRQNQRRLTLVYGNYNYVAMQGVQTPDAPNPEETDTEVVIKSAMSSA